MKHVESILKELNGIDGEPEFLNYYCTSFESFATGTNYISELFRYLVGDRIDRIGFVWFSLTKSL